MDAVAGVKQAGPHQMPDLMRSERPDLGGLGELVEAVGEVACRDSDLD